MPHVSLKSKFLENQRQFLSLIINEGEQIWLRIICYKLFNSKKSWEVIKVSRCNRIREKDVVFFVTRHT